MILSFHPCYEVAVNRLCAGRDPNSEDLAAIRKASAVILPQGCRQTLYEMARANCQNVFPNYDARFAYPGKTGQVRLFRESRISHPRSWTFSRLEQFERWRKTATVLAFPLVFKLDWGGEGETVMLIENQTDLDRALAKAGDYERSGQHGFLLQSMIPHGHRALRVVVIGRILKTYWRVQDDNAVFGTSLSKGAHVDHDVGPEIERAALSLTRRVCERTRIDLAGLDFLFHEADLASPDPTPLMLEINYFFGREGLGGSMPFYDLLQAAVDDWLANIGPVSTQTETP